MGLPGFDEWLTREPREYAAEDPCPSCGRQLVDAHECSCGWNEYEAIEDGAALTGDARRAIEADGGTVLASGAASGSAGLNPASPSFGQVPVRYPNLRDGIKAKLAEVAPAHAAGRKR